jgi:ribosomal protein S17E
MSNIAQDFGSDSRRIKRRISGYATLDATQKPNQKISKMGPLVISTALTP